MDLQPKIRRKNKKILNDPSRVITRLNLPHGLHRVQKIIQRVLDLPDALAESVLDNTLLEFSERHKNINGVFQRNFNEVSNFVPNNANLNDTKRALIGAYFTMEYSVESAGLFNPSIVMHPDQSHLEKDNMRFIMSLRGVGEGHISSIVFRSGILDEHNTFIFEPVSDYVETPEVKLNPVYDRHLFQLKLNEISVSNEITAFILNQLPDNFTYEMLKEKISSLTNKSIFPEKKQNETFEHMHWLANSNYELMFNSDHSVSERVIFPVSENESNGIEDARFVRFIDDNQEVTYYATYTAYSGYKLLPQLIETKDFLSFKAITLNGKAIQDKGMALFPRKINGCYAMLSRQDGENNYIMYSDNIHFWQKAEIIQEPTWPWEFVQIGNNGSPLETDEGWLVLTHGVGPMRQYCIGAILLDFNNPTNVVARLKNPLLTPHETEREGYVPNVVYTCGAIIHNNELIIPYTAADTISGTVLVDVNELISCMQ